VNDGEILKTNPSRERYAMLGQVDRFLGRIETGHYRIYDLM